jgi:hypothetical protein
VESVDDEDAREKAKVNYADLIKELKQRFELMWVKIEKINNQVVKTLKELTEREGMK